MDVEQGIELLLRGLLEAGTNADPGVVDQIVELRTLPLPSEQLFHLLCEGDKGGAYPHIQRQGMGLNPERPGLGHDGRRLVGLAAVGDDEIHPLAARARALCLPRPRLAPVMRAMGLVMV